MHAAPTQDNTQPAVMQLTLVSMAGPATLAPAAVVLPQPSEAAPAATSTRRASAQREEPARPAPVALAKTPTTQAPQPVADAAIEHLPTSALDVPPMPRSAPDEQYVEHVHRSGLPIQVRLYIDGSGNVTETSLLGAAPGDEEAAEQVMAMFRETAFSPGRLQGREVASFIDIELVLEPTLPPLGRVVRQ